MKSNKFSSYFVEALFRAMKLTETKTSLSLTSNIKSFSKNCGFSILSTLSRIINRKSKSSSVQTKLTINTIQSHVKNPIKILNPYSYFQKGFRKDQKEWPTSDQQNNCPVLFSFLFCQNNLFIYLRQVRLKFICNMFVTKSILSYFVGRSKVRPVQAILRNFT